MDRLKVFRNLAAICLCIAVSPAALDSADPATRVFEVAHCEVQFLEEVAVPALHSGPLARIAAQLNQEVKRGEVIAQIDDSLLQLQRQSLKLERDAALEKVADDVELQFALTAQREAEAELNATKDVVTKNPGVVAEVAQRRLRLAVERADLDVKQSRKALRLAQIAVSIKSNELQTLDQQLSRYQVICPIDGVVRELPRRTGEWAGEGEMIAKVARLDRVKVDALVNATASDLRRFNNARVSVSWRDQEEERVLHGRVTSVDTQVYGTSQLRVHAEIDNQRDASGWKLLPGMDVRMSIYPGLAVAEKPR